MEGGAGGTDDEHQRSDADEYDDDDDDHDDDAETEAEPYEEAIVRRELPEAPFSEVDGLKLHLVTSKDRPTSTGNTPSSCTPTLGPPPASPVARTYTLAAPQSCNPFTSYLRASQATLASTACPTFRATSASRRSSRTRS